MEEPLEASLFYPPGRTTAKVKAGDVLWKFSRMNEYEHIRDRKFSLWLTVGSPLGEPAVQEGLYDADEPEDGRYPASIAKWVNISARDDVVAADATTSNDFSEMKRKGANPHQDRHLEHLQLLDGRQRQHPAQVLRLPQPPGLCRTTQSVGRGLRSGLSSSSSKALPQATSQGCVLS